VGSIWNRIGDVATTTGKNLFKFGGEVLGAVTAPAKFAWDIGTAPWNDADEYNGFIQPFKTAADDATKDFIKPLASAGGAIMKVPGVQPALERINKINQEFIREPLTTYNLVIGDITSGREPIGSIFDPNEWKKAYTGAQDISFGQAVVSSYRNIYDPKFNVYDPRQREQAFKKSAWGKWTSGTFDLGVQLFGDVTLAAGKAAKVLKASEVGVGKLTNADAVAKAAEDITKAQYGVNNRFTKVIDDFTERDSAYAISHPMVKSSNNPALLAHLLGDSVDRDETALILRSALGDAAALDELALQRAYITDALKTARGDLSAVDEYKLYAAPDDSGLIPFLNDNEAVIKEAKDNYESLAKTDKYFADLMQVGGASFDEAGNVIMGGGSLTRTTGKALQGFENFVANARSLKFYDREIGSPNVEVFQPTPFHRLYQKVSWAAGERPAGLVDFNDADSYKEIIATVNKLGPTSGNKAVPRNLRNLGLFTAEESKKLLDIYMAASTPEARFIATVNIESSAMRALAKKHDITEQAAEQIYNDYKGARTSALKSIKDNGFMVDLDDKIIKVPQLESQTADFLPLMDFQLMDNLLKGQKSVINALSGRAVNTTLHYADVLQDAFKAGALLRLGYTQRNAIDSQLRIAASVGAMATLQHLGKGTKNFINNTIAVPARMIDQYRPVDAGMTLRQVQASSTNIIRELDELKKQIGEAETKLSLKPGNVKLSGEVNTLKLLQEEKQAVYQHYVDVLNRSKSAKPKDRIGTGLIEVTTSDGSKYELYDAFGGPLGDLFRKIASSGNSFERMVDSNTDMYMRQLSSKGIAQIRPTDPGYFDQWAQTLRQQFGNSAVVKKIIAGESLEDISVWLSNSPAGRDLRRRLALESRDSAEYVSRINGFLDKYLPVSSNLRSKIGEITANDLRSTFTDTTTLPIIHGHLLEEAMFNTSMIKGREIINTLFKFLGTLPEDTLARNPLYVHFYRQEAKRRVDIVAGIKGDKFVKADQEAIMAAAHKTALREMKGVLFNIERKSNLAAAMKYISPFFSAQENAYKTWSKMVVANPALVNRGYLVWNSPNKQGFVTDQDGNPVESGKTSGNDVIWVSLPKGITKIPGLNSLTELGIPKASLDIIFQGGLDVLYMQGNPNIASDIFPVGPYIGVPVSEVVKRQPSLEDAFRFALPFGPTKNAVSGFLPTWFQKLQTRAGGLSDPQFANTYQLIWKTEQEKAKRNGLEPVDPNKIMQMTKDYWSMRTAASLIMPFAPRFDSPYKYYMDKSREYKRLYGMKADEKFFDDYPDFFSFASSLSANPTSVQSTVQATKNINKYSGLIRDLAEIEPKLIGLVVNDPTTYDFSQAAYRYLQGKQISPNSPQKFLSAQSPAEAQRKNEAEKGWITYNKFADALDEELKKRQLSSIQQSGAEDLKYMKEQIIFKLSVQTDPSGKPIIDPTTGTFARTAWYDDYLDSDGSKTNRVIAGLGKIINDEDFMKKNGNGKNTTWKSVSVYLDLRKQIAAQLSAREVKSIDAKANGDLKYMYDAVVSKLKNDDKLGFAYLYDRFLSQDLVYDKYLTPKETK
jgi:hypothetical protein